MEEQIIVVPPPAREKMKYAFKVEDGKAVDHRPEGHKDTKTKGETWIVCDVPEGCPPFNELITARALTIVDGKMQWEIDWRENAPAPVESVRLGDVVRALKSKGVISDEDIQAEVTLRTVTTIPTRK